MTAIVDELRSLLYLVIGASMAVLGSKMHDELIRGIGLTIVGTALGITVPGALSRFRTPAIGRTTDEPPERQQSGR